MPISLLLKTAGAERKFFSFMWPFGNPFERGSFARLLEMIGFFHPHEGKAWEVSVPDETMKGVLRCFDRMEMEIGGMDLIGGEDGYYALEVNDFPGGIKLIGNWSQIITDLVVKTVQTNQERMK